jgi:hypothetical protein
MNFKIKTLLAAASTALLLTTVTIACNKDKVSTQKTTTTSNSASRLTGDDACTTCGCSGGIDSAQVFGVDITDVGSYIAWTPIESDFCGTGPQVTFEGQFNSIIKGAAGWTVGYLNGVSYDTELSTLNCSTVTANIVPTQGNYIGNENPTSCPTCPGYYNYSTGDFTRLVTVSKCCPEDGTIKVYVIKVTTLDAYSLDGWSTFNSKVVYEYKCFTCELSGTCPTTPGATAKSAAPVHEVWKEIPPMFLKHAKK